jgi:biofilm PGA synthesis N-glycosyltransferase PgaC
MSIAEGPEPTVATQPPPVGARVLIVSPVRNEAAHIERVVLAVAAQVIPPADWIVIDDASTDDTLAILRSLEAEVPFMHVLSRGDVDPLADAKDRLARAAEIRNFNVALSAVDWRDYTHVMKLDGDVELPSGYLAGLLDQFAADPGLGIAGGILVEPAPGGMRPIRIAPEHVHGAVKCYAHDCFAAIGGVMERLGWDTIDETYARMRGYRTRSFDELVGVHHRPLASADGVLRGRARHGECAYIAQFSPLWVTLRAVKVARSRPFGISGAAFLWGYIRAGLRGVERVDDPEFRRFVRRELRGRMLRGLRRAAPALRARRTVRA